MYEALSYPYMQVLAIDASSAALRHEIAFVLGQLEFTSENGGEEDQAEEVRVSSALGHKI